jgi:hypothetical protein
MKKTIITAISDYDAAKRRSGLEKFAEHWGTKQKQDEHFQRKYDVEGVEEVNYNGSRRQKILQNARKKLESGDSIDISLGYFSDKHFIYQFMLCSKDIEYPSYKRCFVELSSTKSTYVETADDYSTREHTTVLGIIGWLPKTVHKDLLEFVKNPAKIKLNSISANFCRFYEFTNEKEILIGCTVEVEYRL